MPYEIHKKMYENATIGALVLEKLVLSTLEFRNSDKISVLTMTQGMLRDSGAHFDDADGLINIPLQSRSIEVSVFLKEDSEGKRRCSLRSKGRVNVSTIAQAFGGGGHKTAAGFKHSEPLDAIKEKVLERVVAALAK
jgi:bifunctional oligoribonuclease and PAP phosphatase NrnA